MHAIVWRRLLRAGWQNPETLGRAICSLTWALPLLTASETSYDAGELIKQMYPLLDAAERECIERVILSMSTGQDQRATPKERAAIGRIQARLLGCLPDGVLLTEARGLRDALLAAGALPANTEPVAQTVARWGSDEEAPPVAELGDVRPTTPEARLDMAAIPVATFIEQYRQTVPSLDQIADAWPMIRLLLEELQRALEESVDREVLQSLWSVLIRACQVLAGAANFTCADEPGAFTRAALLAATMHSDPQPTPQSEAQFGEFPSWDGSAIRVNAAAGLMLLAQHVTCLNEDVRSAIWRLAADPVASVRTQVAWRVIMLYESDTPLMWKLIDHFSLNEMNYGVLNLLLRDPLARLVGAHGDRVVSHVETIYHRIMTAQDADRVREACIDIFLNRYLCQDDPVCTHHLDTTINEPEQHGAELQHLLSVLRRPLTLGLPDGDGDGDVDDSNHGSVDVDWGTKASRRQEDEIRGRARGMFRRIVESTRETVRVVETAHVGLSWTQWPETDRERLTTLRRVLDVASREFYFASGAYAAQETENGRELSPGALHLTDAQGSKFLEENIDTLEALADIGDPGAAHHVLKTLSAYLDVSPERIFQLIARTLRAANSRGYPFEAAGAELLVQVVERYLAEYRALFRENDAYRLLLLELLDSFVAVGWPNARRLAMRLEVIDR